MKLKLSHLGLFLVLIPNKIFAYSWPVESFNGPHQINATLGENRYNVRFHKGVDIRASAGIAVYPVVNGTVFYITPVEEKDGRVEIQGSGNIIYGYWHIKRSSGLAVGQSVTASVTKLGIVGDIDNPHLHFEEGKGAYNPLRAGGLDNFSDTHAPEIESGSIRIIPQNVNEPPLGPVTEPLTYGKVDIRVDTTDRRIAADGGVPAGEGDHEVGVYKLKYEIIDTQQNQIVKTHENVVFDSIPNTEDAYQYFDLVYYAYDGDYYTYWMTNNPWDSTTQNQFWNTKLKQGETWSGANAAVNSEAAYPDGRYTVHVEAYDIRNNPAVQDQNIIVDNFAPYVKKLEVFQNGQRIYNASWENDTGEMKLSPEGGERQTGDIKAGELITIRAEFSEEVTDVTVTVEDSFVPMYSQAGTGNKIWEGVPYLYPHYRGAFPVEIRARDISGNELDSTPDTIASRNTDGTWLNYEPGNDTTHRIIIGGTDLWSGRWAIIGNETIYGEWVHYIAFGIEFTGSYLHTGLAMPEYEGAGTGKGFEASVEKSFISIEKIMGQTIEFSFIKAPGGFQQMNVGGPEPGYRMPVTPAVDLRDISVDISFYDWQGTELTTTRKQVYLFGGVEHIGYWNWNEDTHKYVFSGFQPNSDFHAGSA